MHEENDYETNEVCLPISSEPYTEVYPPPPHPPGPQVLSFADG